MPCHVTGDERGWQPHESGHFKVLVYTRGIAQRQRLLVCKPQAADDPHQGGQRVILRLPRRMVPKMRPRRSRALCTRCVLAVLAGARREMVACADSDCLTQLMPGLFRSTHRCGGRAPVLSHHGRRHTRELQRCTRVDLTHCDTDRQIPATLVWTSITDSRHPYQGRD